MNFESFRQAVDQVPSAGAVREPYGHLLYALVRFQRPQVIVEIGSWHGYSTAWLARAVQDNGVGHVIAIDNWSLMAVNPSTTMGMLHDLGVGDLVTFRSGDSLHVPWPPRVDFAFIDGNHSFASCAEEISRAAQRGARTVVVHDTTSWWGPRRWLDMARDATVAQGHDAQWDVLELPQDEGLTVCVRRQTSRPVQFSAERYPRGFIGEAELQPTGRVEKSLAG